jgi:hypothetical protein
VALVLALVGFGVAPRPLVNSRFAASDEILLLRQARMVGSASGRVPAAREMPLRGRDPDVILKNAGQHDTRSVDE